MAGDHEFVRHISLNGSAERWWDPWLIIREQPFFYGFFLALS